VVLAGLPNVRFGSLPATEYNSSRVAAIGQKRTSANPQKYISLSSLLVFVDDVVSIVGQMEDDVSKRSKPFLIFLLCAEIIITSGCVILPIPVPSKSHLEFMGREAVDFVEVGKSSRENVLDNLGSPTVLSAEPSIWIYSMREYLSMRWRTCAGVVGGDAGCSKASKGKEKYLFLQIRFDSARIVTHAQIVSLAIGECTDAGFCWNRLPSFRTTRGAEVSAVNYCAVHFYTPNTAISAKLKLDGSDEFDLSMTNNNFQLALLQRRKRPDIGITFDDGSLKHVRVPCDKASAHFVQVDRGTSAYNMRLVPEHVGRRVIISKLALTRVNFE
jgi:hypothetical protein